MTVSRNSNYFPNLNKREVKLKEGVMREVKFEVGKENIFPVLQIPRQCRLVLLVQVNLKYGKTLCSEEGKFLGNLLSFLLARKRS
jgi:hypothetical protein